MPTINYKAEKPFDVLAYNDDAEDFTPSAPLRMEQSNKDGSRLSVYADKELTEKELEFYVSGLHREHPVKIFDTVEIRLNGDDIDMHYKYHMPEIHFERIRRITGYLVGDLDRFNNAKLAEVGDRLKHSTSV